MSRKTDYWLHDMDKPHIVALAIHGGAGGTTTPDMPADLLAAYRNRLRKVLTTTFEHGHSTSLDAVCHAVSQLEDSPLFNAGKGAVFDLAGHTVCESSLMTTQPGFNSKTVAVTGVRRTKNPILLSKVLLQNNRKLGGHAFYSGRTAEEAGWKHGTKKVSKKYYWTKRRWMEHKKGIETANLADLARDTAQESDEEDVDVEPPSADPPAYSTMAPFPPRSTIEDDHEDLAVFDEYAHLTDFLPQGTVGAVALDSDGHLSVATSTGGKTNKFPGRVGDTPSVGSGFWADSWFDHSSKRRPLLLRLLNTLFKRGANKTASEQGLAISGTGDGDFFLRTNFASSLAHRIKFGKAPTDQAIQSSMDELVRLFGSRKGVGGAIILDKQGNAYFPLAASTMNRGLISKATSFQPQVAIFDYESIDVWS